MATEPWTSQHIHPLWWDIYDWFDMPSGLRVPRTVFAALREIANDTTPQQVSHPAQNVRDMLQNYAHGSDRGKQVQAVTRSLLSGDLDAAGPLYDLLSEADIPLADHIHFHLLNGQKPQRWLNWVQTAPHQMAQNARQRYQEFERLRDARQQHLNEGGNTPSADQPVQESRRKGSNKPVRLAARKAPAGGIVHRGIYFPGGRFFPEPLNLPRAAGPHRRRPVLSQDRALAARNEANASVSPQRYARQAVPVPPQIPDDERLDEARMGLRRALGRDEGPHPEEFDPEQVRLGVPRRAPVPIQGLGPVWATDRDALRRLAQTVSIMAGDRRMFPARPNTMHDPSTPEELAHAATRIDPREIAQRYNIGLTNAHEQIHPSHVRRGLEEIVRNPQIAWQMLNDYFAGAGEGYDRMEAIRGTPLWSELDTLASNPREQPLTRQLAAAALDGDSAAFAALADHLQEIGHQAGSIFGHPAVVQEALSPKPRRTRLYDAALQAADEQPVPEQPLQARRRGKPKKYGLRNLLGKVGQGLATGLGKVSQAIRGTGGNLNLPPFEVPSDPGQAWREPFQRGLDYEWYTGARGEPGHPEASLPRGYINSRVSGPIPPINDGGFPIPASHYRVSEVPPSTLQPPTNLPGYRQVNWEDPETRLSLSTGLMNQALGPGWRLEDLPTTPAGYSYYAEGIRPGPLADELQYLLPNGNQGPVSTTQVQQALRQLAANPQPYKEQLTKHLVGDRAKAHFRRIVQASPLARTLHHLITQSPDETISTLAGFTLRGDTVAMRALQDRLLETDNPMQNLPLARLAGFLEKSVNQHGELPVAAERAVYKWLTRHLGQRQDVPGVRPLRELLPKAEPTEPPPSLSPHLPDPEAAARLAQSQRVARRPIIRFRRRR